MRTEEFNFDGLVGPTHNFSGLAYGNVASSAHAQQTSFPKRAALQGLEKMASLMRAGALQGVLPPHERPHIRTLRQLGFIGAAEDIISKLAQENPRLLSMLSSASSMWVANAGTTSPATDTLDGRTHFTPANLSSMFHRSIEHDFTGRVLRAIFANPSHFVHHPVLPGTAFFGDEGAANHTRFCGSDGEHGLALFVYGRSCLQSGTEPKRYPARQTLEASQAVARQHQLHPEHVLFAQQNPEMIDQGVFHNDVIAVGSQNILLCHEHAFVNQTEILARIQEQQEERTQQSFYILEAKTAEIDIQTAINTYLFNTQIIFTRPNMATIIAPQECLENSRVQLFLERIIAEDNPVQDVKYFDLRQSMLNGGGPACLRFRVSLNDIERASLSTNTLLTEDLYAKLKVWIETHYRDELNPADLADPALYRETTQALDELSQILNLGTIYDFQQ